MSNDMKIIYESYRSGNLVPQLTLLEACGFNEEELRAIGADSILNEGILQFGSTLWDKVKDTYKNIEKFAEDKIISFLRKARAGYEKLIEKARKNFPKIMTKNRARLEISAIRLLTTKRHIKLGILIFSAILKAAGGAALEAIANTSEHLQKLKEIMDNLISGDVKTAINSLFGALDALEIKDMVVMFRKFQNDMRSAAGAVAKDQGAGVAGTDLQLAELELFETFRKNLGVIK